jgi:uncharacterized membrane protein
MGVVQVVFGIRLRRGSVTGRHQVDSAEQFGVFHSQSSISVPDRSPSLRRSCEQELDVAVVRKGGVVAFVDMSIIIVANGAARCSAQSATSGGGLASLLK